MTRNRVTEAIERWQANPRNVRLRILSTMHGALDSELREIEEHGPVTIKAYSAAHYDAVSLLRAAAEPEAKDEPPSCGWCGGRHYRDDCTADDRMVP